MTPSGCCDTGCDTLSEAVTQGCTGCDTLCLSMDLLSLIERHPPGEPPVPPGEPRPVHIARTVAANRSRGRPQQGATAKGGSRTPASDIYQEVVRALGGQGLDRERTAVANQVRRR